MNQPDQSSKSLEQSLIEQIRQANMSEIPFEQWTAEQRGRLPLATLNACLDQLVSVVSWVKGVAAASGMVDFEKEVLTEIHLLAAQAGTVGHIKGTVVPGSVDLVIYLIMKSLSLIGATLMTAIDTEKESLVVIGAQNAALKLSRAECARLEAELATLKAQASSKPPVH
jgi:hypothetical protein